MVSQISWIRCDLNVVSCRGIVERVVEKLDRSDRRVMGYVRCVFVEAEGFATFLIAAVITFDVNTTFRTVEARLRRTFDASWFWGRRIRGTGRKIRSRSVA
jgi:hypothetical protein